MMTIIAWTSLAEQYEQLLRRLQDLSPDADMSAILQEVEHIGSELQTLSAPAPGDASALLSLVGRVQQARAACAALIAERRSALIDDQRQARNTAQALKAYGQQKSMTGRYHDRKH